METSQGFYSHPDPMWRCQPRGWRHPCRKELGAGGDRGMLGHPRDAQALLFIEQVCGTSCSAKPLRGLYGLIFSMGLGVISLQVGAITQNEEGRVEPVGLPSRGHTQCCD
jgi:hypothetical protein